MPRPTPNLPFEIRRSSIQGKGAFATRTIRKGGRIVEYTGERIDQDEADRRYDDAQMKRHHTFLFSLEDGSNIDGAVGGNASRFINHSCDPNCAAYEEKGRIFIEALRTIRPGEELGYDYAYARTPGMTKKDEEHYKCLCGAASCRGTILVPEKKAKPRKKAAAETATRKTSSGGRKTSSTGAKKKKTAATKKKTTAVEKTTSAKRKSAATKKSAGTGRGAALKKAASALKKAAAALKKAAGTKAKGAERATGRSKTTRTRR